MKKGFGMTFPKALYDKVLYYGRQSVIGRFFGACGRGFDRMVANSCFFSALKACPEKDCLEQSCFGRGFYRLWSLFPAIGRHLGSHVSNSTIIGYFARTLGNLPALPVAWLGSSLLPLSLSGYALFGVYGFLLFFLPGIIFLMLPCTLQGLLCGSRIVGFFCTVSGETQRVRAGFYWPPFLIGMISILLGYFTDPKIGLLLPILIYSGAVLLSYPQAGLMLLLFTAPFLPTMVLAALTLVIFFCYLAAQMGGANRSFSLDYTGICIAAFGLLLLFFGFTSYTPVKSTQIAALECCFILSYFLILWLIRSKKAVHAMVFLFCLGAFGCGLFGLYQYLSGDVNTTWTDTSLFTLQLRVYSTFENPNVYGEYLLLALPCAAVMCYIAKKPLLKFFYGGTALLLLVNLALTYSRGCYLALMFVFFLVVCWGARQLLIFVPFVLLAMPFVLPDSIIHRFTSITNLSDSSTSYRMNIWLGTMNMLENFIFLGIGLGQESFTMFYTRYQMNEVFAPHAHNLFLQVASEMGIAGLVMLIAMLVMFFAVSHRSYKMVKGTRTAWFLLVMMAAMGGYLLEGMFDNVWYNYRVFLIFFMFMGLTATVSRMVLKEGRCVFDETFVNAETAQKKGV